MKLRSLNLKNYRVHQNSTLPIGDATFVILRGRNMSGKTSFAEALSMNLANTTVSLPGDGKGFTKKISQNQQKAIITAEIQGTHLLRNTVTLQTNTSGRTVNTECLDDPDNNKIINGFENFLKDRKEALLIALNTTYYSRLDAKEQANLLAKLVLPSRYEFPKDKMDAVEDMLGEGKVDFDAEPFTVITSAYKLLHKERETINRQVKEFTIPDALPIPKGVDSDSLNTELKAIRDQRTKLQSERDAAVKAANEIEVKRARLTATREGLIRKRDEDQKKLAAAEANILGEKEVTALTHVAGKAEELKSLNSQHSIQRGVISTLGEQISKFKDMSEAGGDCPVCEQSIEPAKLAIVIADFEKEYAEADRKIQELDTKIEAIGDVQAAKDSLKKHTDAVKEKAEIEKSLLDTVATGKTTRAELDALPAAVNATLSFNDPIGDLQTKEDAINEQLRPVIAAEERASEITRLTAQKEKLVKKAATLDSLVKFFDKDGVKKTLIEKHIGGFESKLKDVMSAWGYEASLSEDLRFEVTTKRGYAGMVKELSGAEDFIFNAALQCAVSIASGIKLVVIDEVEKLGTDIRNFIYAKCFELIQDGQLDQAILIGFSLDKTLPKPQAPGSRYFYVEDGTVEELK